jgi:hypothetical protein
VTIKRIQVKETKEYYGDFEGSLESIIHSFQANLDAGWEGIESEYEYDGYGGERYKVYYLYKHREENDKEYKKRMKLLETEKQQKEKAKAQKLEKLKKELSSLSKEEKEQLGLIGDNK